MKTLLIAFLALIGMSFIAPDAEARSRDRYRYKSGKYYSSSSYRHYPRYYYRSPRRYYYHRPVRYYYRDYSYPRYYYREPGVTLRFNF
jgi:hypothetical protein